MSREKLNEILSHVDMSKINQSSYVIGSKKFDELARIFTNRVIACSVSQIINKDIPDNQKNTSWDMLTEVINNPERYMYATIHVQARQDVDNIIADHLAYYHRNDPTVKKKRNQFIEDRIKTNYKQMREILVQILESPDEELKIECDDEKCAELLEFAKTIMGKSLDQSVVDPTNGPVSVPVSESHVEQVDSIREEPPVKVTEETIHLDENVMITEKIEDHPQNNEDVVETPKLPFWKRLFKTH